MNALNAVGASRWGTSPMWRRVSISSTRKNTMIPIAPGRRAPVTAAGSGGADGAEDGVGDAEGDVADGAEGRPGHALAVPGLVPGSVHGEIRRGVDVPLAGDRDVAGPTEHRGRTSHDVPGARQRS